MLSKKEFEEIVQRANAAKDDLMKEMRNDPMRGCQSMTNGAACLLSDARENGTVDSYIVAVGRRIGEDNYFISAKAEVYREELEIMMAELICKVCNYDVDQAEDLLYALVGKIEKISWKKKAGEYDGR